MPTPTRIIVMLSTAARKFAVLGFGVVGLSALEVAVLPPERLLVPSGKGGAVVFTRRGNMKALGDLVVVKEPQTSQEQVADFATNVIGNGIAAAMIMGLATLVI